jgi:hypothetical protein
VPDHRPAQHQPALRIPRAKDRINLNYSFTDTRLACHGALNFTSPRTQFRDCKCGQVPDDPDADIRDAFFALQIGRSFSFHSTRFNAALEPPLAPARQARLTCAGIALMKSMKARSGGETNRRSE